MIFLAAFTLSSCDEDERIGYNLSGHWFGDLDMWIDGEKAQGSEIEFNPTGWGASSGRGVEVDYYYYGSVTHYFNYHIRDGIIFMRFDDPNLDCAIVDYRLSTYYFSGYIAEYSTLMNQTYFNLRSYDAYWDDYGYDIYYYSKGEAFQSDSLQSDNIPSKPQQDKPFCIRGVNRNKN